MRLNGYHALAAAALAALVGGGIYLAADAPLVPAKPGRDSVVAGARDGTVIFSGGAPEVARRDGAGQTDEVVESPGGGPMLVRRREYWTARRSMPAADRGGRSERMAESVGSPRQQGAFSDWADAPALVVAAAPREQKAEVGPWRAARMAGEAKRKEALKGVVPRAPMALVDVESLVPGLSEVQRTAIQELREDFVREVGGPNQDPNDETYGQRWRDAQPRADEEFRAKVGNVIADQVALAAAQEAYLAAGR